MPILDNRDHHSVIITEAEEADDFDLEVKLIIQDAILHFGAFVTKMRAKTGGQEQMLL